MGRSRLAYNSEYQHRCEGTPLKVDTQGCHNRGDDWIGLGNNAGAVPVAGGDVDRGARLLRRAVHDQPVPWTMPVSNKLLLEAGYTPFRYNPIFGHPPPDGITNLIPVTEQSNAINPATGLRYAPQPNYRVPRCRILGMGGRQDRRLAGDGVLRHRRAQHEGRLPGQPAGSARQRRSRTRPQLAYRFNQGVPNAVTLLAAGLRPPHDHQPGRLLRPGQLDARAA